MRFSIKFRSSELLLVKTMDFSFHNLLTLIEYRVISFGSINQNRVLLSLTLVLAACNVGKS